MSKSDPFAVMYIKKNGTWTEAGRTEVIANQRNPSFATGVKVLYNFERTQEMKIIVLDLDSGQDPVRVQPQQCDNLGEAEFSLGSLVSANNHCLQLELKHKSDTKSKVKLSACELPASKEVLEFIISARALLNVDAFSKSDPFLEIARMNDDQGAWVSVYRTEVKNNNLNPVWDPIKLRNALLNTGDNYKPIRLRVYDYQTNGAHRLLGEVQVNTDKLKTMAGTGTEVELGDCPGAVDAGKKSRGALMVKVWKGQLQPSFLDYISAGVELNFMAAIDFTASNGPPTDPRSKHYINPQGGYTAYENAILGVGRVLEFYDNDRQYPVFGFGGRWGTYPVNHCFPLTGNDQNPFCGGVAGILGAYRQALSSWQLSGPTLFAPLIRHAASWAAQTLQPLKYTVLLILTDGCIMDMDDTIDAIIAASALPMSILIVGIGDEDFSAMDALDSDKQLLASRTRPGTTAARDIVQFVQMNKFQDWQNNGDRLAAEVLAELPGQFLAYVRQNNVPLPPSPGPPL